MERSEARDRIARRAMEEILVKGYSKVTMDAISSSLGMSKKTIYQIYPGKRELLKTVLNKFQKEVEEGIVERVAAKNITFRERWSNVFEFIGMQYGRLGPGFVDDLRTAEPEINQSLNAFRVGLVLKYFSRLAEEGSQLGVFRKNLDPRLLSAVYLASVQAILNPVTVQELGIPPAQAYRDLVTLLFEGISERPQDA